MTIESLLPQGQTQPISFLIYTGWQIQWCKVEHQLEIKQEEEQSNNVEGNKRIDEAKAMVSKTRKL